MVGKNQTTSSVLPKTLPGRQAWGRLQIDDYEYDYKQFLEGDFDYDYTKLEVADYDYSTIRVSWLRLHITYHDYNYSVMITIDEEVIIILYIIILYIIL